eukprot:2058964-Pleurochrysis_carterae.AAC.1
MQGTALSLPSPTFCTASESQKRGIEIVSEAERMATPSMVRMAAVAPFAVADARAPARARR